MDPKTKDKSRPKKEKSKDAVSLKQFSPTEQARIILAAEHGERSISDYMAECIRQQVQGTVQISFQKEPQSQ